MRRVACALLAGGVSPVVAVLGPEAAAVRRALAGLPVSFVENPNHADGMGSSVVAGVAALEPEAVAVAVAVGDLPALRGETVGAVTAAAARSDLGIAVPTWQGRRGHPVVFDLARYRRLLLALRGDEGARAILAAHPKDVLEVPVDDSGVVEDLDTPEDYARLRSSARGEVVSRARDRRGR